MSDQFVAELRKIPPVTRTLVASTLGITLPIILRFTTGSWIVFRPETIFTTQPQIWRLYTPFFYGGQGITFVFSTIMLYQYSNALETVQYHRRSPDFAWQLGIACAGIIALNAPLGNAIFFNGMLMSITYLQCRLNPNNTINLYGFFQVPSLYFPFVMVALDLLMSGPQSAIHSMTGIVVGHVWWMLEWMEPTPGRPKPLAGVWSVISRSPNWLRNLIGEGAAGAQVPATEGRSFGTAAAPAGRGLNDRGRGASTATTTGYQWGGAGRRLGTE
jgi:Derlin-2/3